MGAALAGLTIPLAMSDVSISATHTSASITAYQRTTVTKTRVATGPAHTVTAPANRPSFARASQSAAVARVQSNASSSVSPGGGSAPAMVGGLFGQSRTTQVQLLFAPGCNPTTDSPCDPSQATEPPDTQVAVGLRSVVVVTNSSMFVFDRAGHLLPSRQPCPAGYPTPQQAGFSLVGCNPIDLNDLFFSGGLTVLETDARITYDAPTGHFIMSGVTYNSGGSEVDLLVSETADPMAQWDRVPIAASSTTDHILRDQPIMGITDDKVVVSWNAYDQSLPAAQQFQGSQITVIQKSDLVDPAILQVGNVAPTTPDKSRFGLVTAQNLSSGTSAYVVYNNSNPFAAGHPVSLGMFSITGTPNGSNVVMSTDTNFTAAPFTATAPSEPDAAQPGPTTISTGNDRIQGAVWRNGSLWASAEDACGSLACARYFNVSTGGSPSLLQSFDVQVTGQSAYFPAITIDAGGRVLTIFNTSGAAAGQYASLQVAQLCASACPSASSLTTLVSGASMYDCGTACKRGGTGDAWGDYSAATVDPLDQGASIWVAGEFAPSSSINPTGNNWVTAVGHLVASGQSSPGATVPMSVSTLNSFTSGGNPTIAGEVQNTDSTRSAQTVQIFFNELDASNSVVGSDSAFAQVNVLGPGEKSPFRAALTSPATHAVVTGIVDYLGTAPDRNLTRGFAAGDSVDGSGRHISLTIRNDNTSSDVLVGAVLTFRNNSGSPLDSAAAMVNTNATYAVGPSAAGQCQFLIPTGTPGASPGTAYTVMLQTDTPAAGPRWHPAASLGGGPFTTAPHAVSWGPGHADVFWRGTNGDLWHEWMLGTTWYGPQDLGGHLAGEPSVVTPGVGVINVFFKGIDSNLWRTWYSNGWHGPVSLGSGPLGSDPQAAESTAGVVDVFWKGTDNNLWHTWYFGGWYGPQSLGSGPLGSVPHPLMPSPGVVDVFWRGTDNNLWHTWYYNGWNGPGLLGGGPLTTDPHPVSPSSSVIDVFWKGGDNGLWHKWYYNGWNGPEPLGGTLSADPYPVVTGNGAIDVSWVAPDASLNHAFYNAGWWGPELLGGQFLTLTSVLSPISSQAGLVDIFWNGSDVGRNLWHALRN